MLSRGTTHLSRHKPSRVVQKAYEELLFPWLCPAIANEPQRRWHTDSASRKTKSPRSTTCEQPIQLKHTSRRKIGTVSESPDINGSATFPLYADFPGRVLPQSHPSSPDLRKFQPDDLIILPLPENKETPVFKTIRNSGATGDIAQLQENISACFRVGSLDHGAELTRRLMSYLDPQAPQVIEASHEYLGRLLETVYEGAGKESLAKMQKWLELDMRSYNVDPDSTAIALVIKACLLSLQGTKLDRKLRHYLMIARKLGGSIERETLASALFSEDDFVKILRSLPQDYERPVETIKETSLGEARSDAEEPAVHLRDAGSASHRRVPALKSAELKGLGLKTLLKSLQSMEYASGPAVEIDDQESDPQRLLQIRMEQGVLSAALERWRDESSITQEMRQKGVLQDPLLGSFVHDWIKQMTPLVEEEIERSERAQQEQVPSDSLDRILLGPFLKMLSPEKICAATILAYLNSVASAAPEAARRFHGQRVVTLMNAVLKIGGLVETEIRTANVGDNFLHKLGRMRSIQRQETLASLLKQTNERPTAAEPNSQATSFTDESKNQFPDIAEIRDAKSQQPQFRISTDLKIKLGALLFSMFMTVAKLPVTATDRRNGRKVTSVQPVASHSWFWQGGRKHGIVITNSALLNRMKKEPVASFIAKHLPMVVSPRKWQGLRDGAYLTHVSEAVRIKDQNNSQHEYLSIADQRGDLRQLYRGLDVISGVPWRVNRAVFDVLAAVWNTGEPLAKLAPAEPKAEYPPEPDQSDRKAHQQWLQIVKQVDDEVSGHHSERCYQNFQFEVARTFLDQTFYCPHNLDFRGRAYPIPPYFNHMGADYVRALFLFAEGKPLGSEGLSWLKIHLSNCYGLDKESLKARVAFVDEHLEDIYDSVERPLEGRRWWLTGDHPWQTLAACFELAQALDSPEPSQYISHLPIQQDGSCNGLQHYAALGGDEIGARQVNLAPSDKPADIYNAVADMVRKDVDSDARGGNRNAQILHGNLTRKVVKQPVMTNVYGVTHFGAVAQVKKQLLDILPKPTLENNINMDELSRYVASLIFKAMSEMFTGAHAIQSWLGECGARISQAVTPEQMERLEKRRLEATHEESKTPKGTRKRSEKPMVKAQKRLKNMEDYQFKSTIVWTTPLGMPVVQPYRQSTVKAIKTSMQSLYISNSSLSDPVKKDKQLAAFPPNFIHSLDATHMLLSALKCNEVGLTFAAVHDSFWTHASDVPTMNRILRDAFVRMHSEDIIGRLYEEFVARYSGCLRWAAIEMDSALGRKIEEHLRGEKYAMAAYSKATVSHKGQVDLLMKEYERLKLLQSSDPGENERGRRLVTPAALFESESGGTESGLVELMDTAARQSVEAHNMLVDDEGLDGFHHSEVGDAELDKDDAVYDADNGGTSPIKRPGKKPPSYIYFWMPLTFPDPPKKGSFNVQKLQGSQYFFS